MRSIVHSTRMYRMGINSYKCSRNRNWHFIDNWHLQNSRISIFWYEKERRNPNSGYNYSNKSLKKRNLAANTTWYAYVAWVKKSKFVLNSDWPYYECKQKTLLLLVEGDIVWKWSILDYTCLNHKWEENTTTNLIPSNLITKFNNSNNISTFGTKIRTKKTLRKTIQLWIIIDNISINYSNLTFFSNNQSLIIGFN